MLLSSAKFEVLLSVAKCKVLQSVIGCYKVQSATKCKVLQSATQWEMLRNAGSCREVLSCRSNPQIISAVKSTAGHFIIEINFNDFPKLPANTASRLGGAIEKGKKWYFVRILSQSA